MHSFYFRGHLQIFCHTPKVMDAKSGVEKPVTVFVDECIRPGTNMNDLEKLKPKFKKDGCTTAGFMFTQSLCLFIKYEILLILKLMSFYREYLSKW